jgi:hypothetical protein
VNTHQNQSGAATVAAHNTANIPGAFYEMMYEMGVEVPTEEEIRRIGKGKQYEVRRDASFDALVAQADNYLAPQHAGTKLQAAAIAMLRSLRNQGIKLTLQHDLPAPRTRRMVWIKTDAVVSSGKYRGRKLIAGIDCATGTLAVRIAGTRQITRDTLPAINTRCTKWDAERKIREAKAARKAARLARKRGIVS